MLEGKTLEEKHEQHIDIQLTSDDTIYMKEDDVVVVDRRRNPGKALLGLGPEDNKYY
jgi:hypothetical protein